MTAADTRMLRVDVGAGFEVLTKAR
jgi:hypothetical protein